MSIFLEPPNHFAPKVEACGCFCECEDRILLLKRSAHKVHPLTWSIPGGKLEKGESAKAGVIRELFEETGILLVPARVLSLKTLYVCDEVDFIFHIFKTRFEVRPRIVINEEHCDLAWVTEKDYFSFPLIPGGKECFDLAYSPSARACDGR